MGFAPASRRVRGLPDLHLVARVTNEELPLVHVGGNGDVEEANHHFIVSLLAPADGAFRIGVMGIVA